MILNSNILGQNNKKYILILHGLYGCADSWLNVGKSLSTNYCVHLLDLRNHGNSFHSDRFDYESMVDDIKNYTSFHGLNKFNIIGHSMGGKVTMSFANKYPECLDNIIIADISPRPYKSLNNNEPNTNFHLNLISNIKNLDISEIKNFSEIEVNLNNYNKNIKNLILKNLKKEAGKLIWKINVDSIFKNINNIFDGLDIEKHIENKIKTRCLFLKATNSEYICDIDRKIIDFIFSDSIVVDIPKAGHWLHIDQTEIVINEIQKFLDLK